jgi:hypothetical protein
MAQAPSTQILLQDLNSGLNGVLGGLPVAEQTQDYFLIFKGVGGTGPEIIDNTAYFIQYVVDSNGDIFKPSQGSIARLNILQNFPTGKLTTVRIDNASGINTQLDGDHIITGLGTQQPILYTQYGIPSSSYTQSISFITPNSAPPEIYTPVNNILGSMVKSNFTFNSSSATTITGYTQTLPPSTGANFNTSLGRYHITSSEVTDINSITFRISYNIFNANRDDVQVLVQLRASGSSGENLYGGENIFTIPSDVGINQSNNITVNLPTSYNNPFFVIKMAVDGGKTVQVTSLNFEIPSTSPMPSAQSQTTFWFTGSHTDITWLTASAYLSLNYGNIQNSDAFPQAASFNLSPIKTTFTPQPGDRIRFEYDPQKDYIIYEVISPDVDEDGLLKLKLNKVLSPNIILDNFILHRVDNSILKYIILDVPKDPTVDNPENPFTGIVLPKYPSEKLKNNLENILLKLKQAGVLQN